MTIGTIFKKTSGIRYEVLSISESNITCRQLDGAGEGREVVFKKAQIEENLNNKKFKVVSEAQDSKEESDMTKKTVEAQETAKATKTTAKKTTATKKQAKATTKKTAETTEKAPEQAAPVEELTPEKKAKVMDKIRKCLALKNNTPSAEEAVAAALQAQKLMAKYNIHQDEVEWEEVKKDISSVMVEAIEKRVLMAWRKQLAVIIGENFRCKVYMHGNAIAFRGYKEDTKIAAEVFKAIYIIGDKLAMKEQARIQKATGSGKGMYNSYIVGFLEGIQDGLGEQSTALMIVTPKEVQDEWETFAAKFGTKKTKNLRVIDAEAYTQGKKDGKAAVKSRQIEKKTA